MRNALAVFIPMAWQILLIRYVAKEHRTEPATRIFTEVQLKILHKFAHRPPPKNKATIYDAMMAVASLGGHIKNNGMPGWMVLGRGYEKLLSYQQVWKTATSNQ